MSDIALVVWLVAVTILSVITFLACLGSIGQNQKLMQAQQQITLMLARAAHTAAQRAVAEALTQQEQFEAAAQLREAEVVLKEATDRAQTKR